MSSSPNNLLIFQSACKSLIDDVAHNDFFVLSGLTDRSYEEGDRNDEFRIEVEQYESAGLPDFLCRKLRSGINGILHEILAQRNPEMQVHRNKWAGQDLYFRHPATREAAAEVKLLFDCTTQNHYANLSHDFQKLEQLRADGFHGDLFLAVVFVTFPKYLYPSGTWLGKRWRARSSYMRNCHIENQKTLSCLMCQPVWPKNAQPHTRELAPPSTEAFTVVSGLFAKNFQTNDPWQFDPVSHLCDAKVAVAIWQYP